jgi:hypothetical protein
MLYMSGDLQKMLGTVIGTTPVCNQAVIANNVFELNRGLNLMYVYCDIASHSTVGDTKAPLLRVCSISGKHGRLFVQFLLILITSRLDAKNLILLKSF